MGFHTANHVDYLGEVFETLPAHCLTWRRDKTCPAPSHASPNTAGGVSHPQSFPSSDFRAWNLVRLTNLHKSFKLHKHNATHCYVLKCVRTRFTVKLSMLSYVSVNVMLPMFFVLWESTQISTYSDRGGIFEPIGNRQPKSNGVRKLKLICPIEVYFSNCRFLAYIKQT